VNHFHAAGGMGLVIRELLDAGLLHERHRLRARRRPAPAGDGTVARRSHAALAHAPATSLDENVVRGVAEPFDSEGGLRCLQGNLGRAVVKISAVAPEHAPDRSAGAHLRIAGRAAGRVQGRCARSE
jgi:phosphogluconate dehydratase